jgi:hypothetical protein
MNREFHQRSIGIFSTVLTLFLASACANRDTRDFCELRSQYIGGNSGILHELLNDIDNRGRPAFAMSEDSRANEFRYMLKREIYIKNFSERLILADLLYSGHWPIDLSREAAFCVEAASTTSELDGCMNEFAWWNEIDPETVYSCPFLKTRTAE